MRCPVFWMFLSLVWPATSVLAQAPQQSPAQNQPLGTITQQASYLFGRDIGRTLKQQGLELDLKALMLGIQEALEGKPSRIPREKVQEVFQQLAKQLAAKRKAEAERNKKAGEEFLAANAKRPGVVTLPSGVQYEVIREGKGQKPKPSDTVTVHYQGTLLDGTVFDSSYKRKRPATFRLDRVIKGWSEAVQQMRPGAKYKVYIPAHLAYGENPPPGLPPNATLIFEIELLEVKPSPPQGRKPGQPQFRIRP